MKRTHDCVRAVCVGARGLFVWVCVGIVYVYTWSNVVLAIGRTCMNDVRAARPVCVRAHCLYLSEHTTVAISVICVAVRVCPSVVMADDYVDKLLVCRRREHRYSTVGVYIYTSVYRKSCRWLRWRLEWIRRTCIRLFMNVCRFAARNANHENIVKA